MSDSLFICGSQTAAQTEKKSCYWVKTQQPIIICWHLCVDPMLHNCPVLSYHPVSTARESWTRSSDYCTRAHRIWNLTQREIIKENKSVALKYVNALKKGKKKRKKCSDLYKRSVAVQTSLSDFQVFCGKWDLEYDRAPNILMCSFPARMLMPCPDH